MPYIIPQIITLNAKKIFTYFPKKPGNDAGLLRLVSSSCQ